MFEIFEFAFMQRALWASLLVSVVAPTIGLFLVVRGYSLLSDTLAHVSLAGVASGALVGVHPIAGALVFSVFASVLIQALREKTRVFGEAILALFLSGSLALAVILFSLGNGINSGVIGILFGSITTVTRQDLWLMSLLFVIVVTLVAILYRGLFLVAFDDELAHASGYRVRWIELLLLVLAAMVVALSIRMVGTLLIGAMMVIPVLTAMRLGNGFRKTHLAAIGFALFSSVGGLFASFYLNLPSGAAMVVLALSAYVVVHLLTPRAAA